MKKIAALSFVFIFGLAMVAVPVVALGQNIPTGPTAPPSPPTDFNLNYIVGLVGTALNFVFAIFLIVSVIMIVLAAFQFLQGPEKAAEARGKLMWAVVGIAIALLSRGVEPLLKAILGIN
ncbi:MAG: hypothetical protein Q8P39_03075 [Candidatus Yanofskybacteria bacterium]|nr:hypothetical protein [Candidatus Yanofskybacteria bacterium]